MSPDPCWHDARSDRSAERTRLFCQHLVDAALCVGSDRVSVVYVREFCFFFFTIRLCSSALASIYSLAFFCCFVLFGYALHAAHTYLLNLLEWRIYSGCGLCVCVVLLSPHIFIFPRLDPWSHIYFPGDAFRVVLSVHFASVFYI